MTTSRCDTVALHFYTTWNHKLITPCLVTRDPPNEKHVAAERKRTSNLGSISGRRSDSVGRAFYADVVGSTRIPRARRINPHSYAVTPTSKACCVRLDPIACSTSCSAHHVRQKRLTGRTWPGLACRLRTDEIFAAGRSLHKQPPPRCDGVHPAWDYRGRARDASHSVARSIASCSQLDGARAYLHTVAEKFLQKIHAVAASAPSATWWIDVASETPNNTSFITSFGASPRACSRWYICEPQWTAEGQYPASTGCPSYVVFFILSPAMDCHIFVSTNNMLTL